jgi:hypothetical protein
MEVVAVGHQLSLEEVEEVEEEEAVVVVVDSLLAVEVAEECHCHSSSEVVEAVQIYQD